MKKTITYFAGSFVLAMAFAFGLNFTTSAGTAQSCKGKCQRSQNACLNSAKTTAQRAQCNKSYQGCISSCKN